jgi:hypothetical protein
MCARKQEQPLAANILRRQIVAGKPSSELKAKIYLDTSRRDTHHLSALKSAKVPRYLDTQNGSLRPRLSPSCNRAHPSHPSRPLLGRRRTAHAKINRLPPLQGNL